MEKLNDAFYALPAQQRFPLDSAEATKSSYGAYKMQKQAFAQPQQEAIEANFNKAAAYYGIDLEYEQEKRVERPVLMFKGASEAIDMHEIESKKELEQAVDFILEKRASTTRESLAEPAKYILWVAANSDVDMTTDKFRKIARIAGIGVPDRDEAQYELEKRAVVHQLSKENSDALWKFAREVKALSDEDFYREDNLCTLCDTIDRIDFMYGAQHKHASDLGYPEDVVFKDGLDDLIEQTSDLYYVKSIDSTLSKKATLERKNSINAFMKAHFSDYEDLDNEELINKVASLNESTAAALIEAIA